MKILCAAIVLWAMAAVINTYGQCDNLADKVLCVYTLTPAQAATFSTSDHTVSSFWTTDWAGRDYVQLTPPDNCYPGYCNFAGGATDARMTIKAGGTAQGLYLYIEIQDNVWVDRANDADTGADLVNIFFDDSSSAYIGACTDCRIDSVGSFLSYTTSEIQCWMGGQNSPTGVNYQYYDNALWRWGAHSVTWVEATSQYNLHAEVVTVDATHKVQEWFIPWSSFGNGGFPFGTSVNGRRLGFAAGYNDKDGDNSIEDKLSLTGKDPRASDANYWGDLLLPSDLQTICCSAAEPVKAVGVNAGRVIAIEYYSLSGSSIAPQNLQQLPANSVCVKVSRFADGRRVSAVAKVVK